MELINLLKEKKTLKDQLDTKSKHENKMQNVKKQFEEKAWLTNGQLNKAHHTIEKQVL